MASPTHTKSAPALPRSTRGGGNTAAPAWIPIVLILLTFAVFAWACGAEYVTWDDPIHVVDNPGLKLPTLASLGAFWAHPYKNLYIPLTYSMWWLLALVAREPGPSGAMELNPWVFHTASVLLQCVSVVLAWRLLRRLTKSDLAAAAGALLWSVHPLQVESVAWVSAGKDQLCGTLALGALLAFFPATRGGAKSADTRRDVLATLLFAAALLAKPAAVVAPLVAAVLVFYFPHRPRRWRWLALWMGLALADVLITKFAQPVTSPADGGRWWLRPLIAGNALEFYLQKLIAPIGLVIQYNRHPAEVIAQGWKNLRWAVPIVVLAAAWIGRRRFPYLLAGLVIFIVGLLPVLGLVPFQFQEKSAVADHYAHLALLGPALALAWGLSKTPQRWHTLAGAAAGAALAVLGGLSIAQTMVWQDNLTLYSHTLAVNPRSWVAAQNLGSIYENINHDDEAIGYFLQGLQYQPLSAALYADYASALAKTNRFDEAEAAFRTAAQIDPHTPGLQRNWGYMRELRAHWEATHHPTTSPAASPVS